MPRRFHLDLVNNPDTLKKRPLNYLQVWDQIDILLVEATKMDFIWIVDPMHGEDDFFGIIENKFFNDKDTSRKVELRKRTLTLEFYKPGQFDITLVRIKKTHIFDYIKVNQRGKTIADESIIDFRIHIPITIASIEGKMEPK